MNQVASTGHTSVDIGAGANMELVDKFWYLGDMLSVHNNNSNNDNDFVVLSSWLRAIARVHLVHLVSAD